MKNQIDVNELIGLFQNTLNQQPEKIEALPRSGSDRCYYRMTAGDVTLIGAYNENTSENEAFFSFTETFFEHGCKVPELIAIAPNRKYYLLSDLGDSTLFNIISQNPGNPDKLCCLKKSLKALVKFQLKGAKYIDFSKCYPRETFDQQSIMWDLNYFKYEFLKLAAVPFDEQRLEDDFETLSRYLLKAPARFFMHRDFQTRNIMIQNDEPWFIDYQGGRKGPLQYDVASLLFSPKTTLNNIQREALLDFYIKKLAKHIHVDKEQFIEYYYGFVLIRTLQAMGAYGFRGIFEQKPNFKSSIPLAIRTLDELFSNSQLMVKLPEIEKISCYLSSSKWAQKVDIPADKLTIRVSSFSFKNRIPADPSENGGGFVFDCRGLPNPGRLPEYRSLNGTDQEVIDYLQQFSEVAGFEKNVRSILSISIDEYLKRGFNHLCVNFGCTGGQHRSVYQAEKFSAWLVNNYPVNVVLLHTEQHNWKK